MDLLFTAGSSDGANMCGDFTVNEDVMTEGDELFGVTLTIDPDSQGLGLTLENDFTTCTIIG